MRCWAEILAARWALARGEAADRFLGRAASEAALAREADPTDRLAWTASAEVEQLRAEAARARRIAADTAIEKGLAFVDRAMAIDPGLLRTLKVRDALARSRGTSAPARDPVLQPYRASRSRSPNRSNMKSIGRFGIAAPLLSAIACADIAVEDEALSATSDAIELSAAGDPAAVPKPGPTQEPRGGGRCAIQSGSTQFFDVATSHCGYVFGNNWFWGELQGGWNDRADQFGNHGTIHSNCLYEHIACGGAAVHLPRGFAVDWFNIVSSNRWTTASTCSANPC